MEAFLNMLRVIAEEHNALPVVLPHCPGCSGDYAKTAVNVLKINMQTTVTINGKSFNAIMTAVCPDCAASTAKDLLSNIRKAMEESTWRLL